MPQTNAKPDEFTLDRDRLTAKMLDDYGELVGIDSFGESDPERIAQATRYATYGGAVACPAEITMIVDALPPTAACGDPLTLREPRGTRPPGNAAAHRRRPVQRTPGLAVEPRDRAPHRQGRRVSGVLLDSRARMRRSDQAAAVIPCDARRGATATRPDRRAAHGPHIRHSCSPELLPLKRAKRSPKVTQTRHGRCGRSSSPRSRRARTTGNGTASRQRAYSVEDRDRPHLARQMLALREELISKGQATAAQLPEPAAGLDSYL